MVVLKSLALSYINCTLYKDYRVNHDVNEFVFYRHALHISICVYLTFQDRRE